MSNFAPPSPSPQAAAPSRLEPERVAELLLHYDRPAPRYTSYPTALDFVELTAAETERRLAEADTAIDSPLSMYVHLPFCEERCWFCGCHVVISPDGRSAAPYLDDVRRELDLLAARLPHRRQLGQLHFGGGTPTFYAPAVLRAFASDLLQLFPLAPDAEVAIEIDPRVTSAEHLEALAEVGFNRVSFGVQDLDPAVQQAIGRIQSEESVDALIRTARRLGFRGINADLIYGLPNQTVESIENTASRVAALGVDRVALYSFAYLPKGRGHQKRMEPGELPQGFEKSRLFAHARDVLLDAGFDTIGMDHFAVADDELSLAKRAGRLRRNFQGYTTLPSSDVVGVGTSAIGDVRGALLQNEKKLTRYSDAIAQGQLPTYRGVVRTADDLLRGRIIADLMCNFVVDYARFEQETGVDPRQAFAPEWQRLKEHEAHGLVTIGDERLEVSGLGQLLVRVVAQVFDAYRTPQSTDAVLPPLGSSKFSRAV